ncbi:hypothetical protein OUZ56_007351 [Daphnia magna]|uniref:Uncharacterized protein n=1 Tax=Daphnia magna TaxID=35525 RepID=A0ABR0A9R2_9CRUS|nr:hypothetical protein OUZ56_007351 [Daphnia magna]
MYEVMGCTMLQIDSGLLDTFPSATREIRVLDLDEISICFEIYQCKQDLNADIPRRRRKRIQ